MSHVILFSRTNYNMQIQISKLFKSEDLLTGGMTTNIVQV